MMLIECFGYLRIQSFLNRMRYDTDVVRFDVYGMATEFNDLNWLEIIAIKLDCIRNRSSGQHELLTHSFCSFVGHFRSGSDCRAHYQRIINLAVIIKAVRYIRVCEPELVRWLH